MITHRALQGVTATEKGEYSPCSLKTDHQGEIRLDGAFCVVARWFAERLRIAGDHRITRRMPGQPATRRRWA